MIITYNDNTYNNKYDNNNYDNNKYDNTNNNNNKISNNMFMCIYIYIYIKVIRQITLNGPAGYTCLANYLSYHN